MATLSRFDQDILKIDPEYEVERISRGLRRILRKRLKRRGLVVALSGGIDSSVTAALAVRSLGPDKVCILLMPERHSSEDTLNLSHQVTSALKVEPIEENITHILEAVQFYKKYDDAVRLAIPGYGRDWKSKIVISSNHTKASKFSLFSIVAQQPDGKQVTSMLPLKAYLEIVAATNFKQRVRKMIEYYHADRLNFAVAGTPNRLEFDQGFFVKLGDGSADIKPIAHLYKTQVYQLAKYLGIPKSVRCRPPTTDTYSLAQSQEEFFFTIPLDKMDLCLYAHNHSLPPDMVSEKIGMPKEIIENVYREIEQKRRTTRYLHLSGLLIEDVPEIATD